MKELTAKLRALDFAVKRSYEVVKTKSSEAISKREQPIVTKINACHMLKDSIEEEKIVKEESEEQVIGWVSGIEQKLKVADKKVLELQGITDGIVRKTHAFQKAEGVKEELMLQEEKHEQKLRQEHELFEQQVRFQKPLEASCQSQAKAVPTKLPKLSITKFDGKYESWLPFGINSLRKLTALIFLR